AVLHAQPPAVVEAKKPGAVDLADRRGRGGENADQAEEEERPQREAPAWHGTLLPRGDADVWLAAAFADYERMFAREKGLTARKKDGELSAADRTRLAEQRYGYRSNYLTAARSAADVPLSRTHAELARDEWYRVAAGKGFWALHELRRAVGDERFADLMESFGKEWAGKEVTAAAFRAHAEKAAGKKLDGFFDYWLDQTGLPALK